MRIAQTSGSVVGARGTYRIRRPVLARRLLFALTLFVGFIVVLPAAVASASPSSPPPPSPTAQGCPSCVYWKVTSVGAPYLIVGPNWFDCAMVAASPFESHPKCTYSWTRGNGYGGQVQVGTSGLSAAVNYNVMSQFSISGGTSYNIPPGISGSIQHAATWNQRNVVQTEYSDWGNAVATANAWTDFLAAPDYRFVASNTQYILASSNSYNQWEVSSCIAYC